MRTGTFASFVRDHNRFLTFFGAMIVFVTFIIKDGVRENLKDVVSSLDTAQSIFAIRSDDASTNESLLSVQSKVHWLQYYMFHEPDATAKAIEPPGGVRFDQPDFVTDAQTLKSAITLTDNVRNLLDRFPPDIATSEKLKTVKDEGDKANKKLIALTITKLANAMFTPQTPDLNMTKNSDLISFHKEVEKVSVDSTELMAEAVKFAEGIKNKKEQLYKVFTYVSYGLYTIGWGLGLVGKLFGAGDVLDSD